MSDSGRQREVLGTGTYATVYAEWDPLLRQSVASKELNRPFADSAPFARAFLARAEQLFDLDDEHVLAIHRSGGSRNAPGFVRELATETLAAALPRSPLPAHEVEEILGQALQGLGALHAHGVVHGAIKPQNLFRCGDRVKVGDFGVAGPGIPPTVSLRYAAPEVLRGEPAGPAADLYSLGLVAYELLLGPAAFEALAGEELPPLQERRAELPMALSRTLQQMTRREPADRIAGAREALASLGEGDAAGRRSATASSRTDTRELDARLRPRIAHPRRQAQRLKWTLASVSVLLLAALAFATVLFLREQRPAEPSGPANQGPRDAPLPPAVAPIPAVPPQVSPPPRSMSMQPGTAAKKPPQKPQEPRQRTEPSSPEPVQPSPGSTRKPKPAAKVSPGAPPEREAEPAAPATAGGAPAPPVESAVLTLERLSKSARKAYAREKKPDATLAVRLKDFASAATGVRKAWRKANGKGFSAFKDRLLRRFSPDANRQNFEARARELVRCGSQVDDLLEKSSMGPATMDIWKEVRRNLKQIEVSLN